MAVARARPRWATARSTRGRSTRQRATRGRSTRSGSSNGVTETLRFLTPRDVVDVAEAHGTPTYVYDALTLESRASIAKEFPNAYGLTVRYAMKA